MPVTYSEPGKPLPMAQWSPDGKRVVYAGGATIFERELASGAVRQVIQRNGLVPTTVAVSPDGRYVAARASLESGSWVLVLIPTSGEEPRELLRADASTASNAVPAWTPDSRSLLVQKPSDGPTPRKMELWLVPIEGGPARKMELEVDARTDQMHVHPDGRQVAWVGGETRCEILVLKNFLPAGKTAGR